MPLAAFAEEEYDDPTESEDFKKIAESVNEGILSGTDDETNEILEENGISADNAGSVNGISVMSVLSGIFTAFTDALAQPVRMLGKIIAIAVLCAVTESLVADGSQTVRLLRTIGVLCSITVIYDSVYSGFEMVSRNLDGLTTFMMSYIPIFSSVTAAGGNLISGGSYYAIMLALCELIAIVSSKILMPFLSVVLAITVVSAINPELSFCGAADSIKKCVQWILGGLMTVFTGLLTVQSFTGAATDSLTSRTLKFAASSFIPIIGGAVSEAYSAVSDSIGVIRSGAGAVGILIVCIMALRPIVVILAIKLVVSVGRIINGMLGLNENAGFLDGVNAVLSIGLSVIIAFSMIFIIATAVLMITALRYGM